jgi:hypothetical protein
MPKGRDRRLETLVMGIMVGAFYFINCKCPEAQRTLYLCSTEVCNVTNFYSAREEATNGETN